MNVSEFQTQHIFVADDDDDDRTLFEEVIKELPYLVHLTTSKDGEETLKILDQFSKLPDLLFLDLNMPIKNGLECLQDIKKNKKFRSLPVIILSTSSYPSAINQSYDAGAHLYIRKPNNFLNFKRAIQYVLSISWKDNLHQPPREEFVFNLS